MDIIIGQNSKKYIQELNKLDFKTKYPNNYTKLGELNNRSFKLIEDILENMLIKNISCSKIKQTNIGNITHYLLKTTSKSPRNSILKKFIEKIKNDSISNKDIEKFINFNNELVSDYVSYLLNNNSSDQIDYLIEQYSNLITSRFIPYSIQTNILKTLHKKFKFTANYKTNNINFIIFYENDIDNKQIIYLSLKALYVCELFNKTNETIKITILLSKNEKKFPTTYNYLGPTEINSGLTQFSVNNEICIFRNEELDKVLMHEMVHALNIDIGIFQNSSINDVEKKIQCNFNVNNNNKINFNECFTETCAVIMNCLVNSIMTGESVIEMFKNERNFSVLQCSKILNFYKMNIGTFFCIDCCFQSNNSWIEKTSVLSYFFLKTANLYNIDEFISNFMFSPNIDIMKLYNFVKNNFRNIKFLVNYSISNELNNSLRMSIYDTILL